MASRRSGSSPGVDPMDSPAIGSVDDTRINIGAGQSGTDTSGAGAASVSAPLLSAPPMSSPAPAPSGQVLRLGFGVFVFFTACSIFEEVAFKGLGKFHFSWFFTFFELMCITTFSIADRWWFDTTVNSVWHHRIALKEHAKVSLYLLIARALTNKSLEYLNIPTQIIFKSMKLLPILLGSTFILKRKHSRLEYVFVVLLALSATVFSLADLEAKSVPKALPTPIITTATATTTLAVVSADAAPALTPATVGAAADDVTSGTKIGVGLVLLSLLFDALFSNSQEFVLRDLKVSDPELMVWSNLFATIGIFFVSATTGEIPGSLAYLQEYGTTAVGCWVGRAVVTYFGVKCWIALIKAAGNVTANVVATVRKILTILLSFFIFSKPFLPKYVIGLMLFALSFVVDYYDRKIKAADALLERQRSILAAETNVAAANAAVTAVVNAAAAAGSANELLPLPAAQSRSN